MERTMNAVFKTDTAAYTRRQAILRQLEGLLRQRAVY